jgi:hypothetical protein
VKIVYTSTIDTDKGVRNMALGAVSVHSALLSKVDIDRLVRELNGLAFGELNLYGSLYS